MPGTKFKVSDESVNTYGFRVMTAGIDWKCFKQNNIALYNHLQPWRGTKDEILPIGNWDNLTKSSGEMFGDFIVDEGDKFAKKIGGKVDRKVIKAASIGIRIIETSKEPKLMLPGQTRETVTKCELREISVVDIGANKNAIALYDDEGNQIELSDNGEGCPVPLLNSTLSDKSNSLKSNSKFNMENLSVVAGFLGLPSDASLTDVQNKISELMTLKAQNKQLSDKLKVIEDEKKTEQQGQVKDLLDKAVESTKIDAAQRPQFESLFDKDFDNAKSILDSLTATPKLSDVVKNKTAVLGDEIMKFQGLTFSEMRKKKPQLLQNLKDTNLETFKQLYKSEYGKEYNA